MTFREENGDLFAEEILQNYALCHCISSDFALGAGIAKAFAALGVKKELCEKYPKQWQGGDTVFLPKQTALRSEIW